MNTLEDNVANLNSVTVNDIDFDKYDKMSFNPLRYEANANSNQFDDDHNEDLYTFSKCPYLTPEQFKMQSFAKKDQFTILNVNIRSLGKNFDKLKNCIKALDHDFSIIGISETHLKDKPNDYYNLPNYNIEYTNRIGREKGGVCLYIKDHIKYKLRQDLCIANSNLESCFIEIENSFGKNVLVGEVYRAHTSIDDFTRDIGKIYSKLSSENKKLYIMGDFNIDLLKEDTQRPIHDYLDMTYSYSLIPTIYKPTRITEHSATIIDNILTNIDNTAETAIIVTDITDHLPTVLVSNMCSKEKEKQKPKVTFKRRYTDDNINLFKSKLSKVDWENILVNANVNVDYTIFLNKFDDLYNECVPLRKCNNKRKRNPRLPWITNGILKSINTKNKLYKEFLQNPTDFRRQKFVTFRNKLHTVIRKSKRSFYFNKFEQAKGNMRQTWKAINDVMGRGRKQNLPKQFKNYTGELITDSKVIADEFNNFFVNVGPELASKINSTGKKFYDYLNDPINSCMFMKPIVETEIVKIINKFNQNKSAGHDNIENAIVKKIANELAKPLALLFNKSVSTGIVPDDLKIAKVIPIHKKNDIEEFSNYRPVSVLPCFSKILERLVFNRCIEYIDSHNILNKHQYGFRANHSTYMAVMQLVDKVNKAVERKDTTVGIFLDLSKAFDTIDHNILLYKMEYYGFRGVVHQWFKSYLDNRKQYVYINSIKSNNQNILCGVPQGSILGPLLFILYVNDITKTSDILNFLLFADDTTILYSHSDIVSKIPLINTELLEVSNWFKANKLSVNASKTNYMLMGTSHMTNSPSLLNANNIILDDSELSRVKTTKFLGLAIDENLTWKKHIDGVTKKISCNIGVMNKIKHFIPERILYSLYCSLVLPYISYGILVWGNACKTYLDKIFKLQKWALRTISNSHYRSHSGPLFLKYNLLNVYDMYNLETGTFMYKYSNGQLPTAFDNIFTTRSKIHSYQTRYKENYQQTRHVTSFSDHCIRTQGPKIWNSLDTKIQTSFSAKHFRNQYKKCLLLCYK